MASDFFKNYRWRKFLINLSRKKYKNYRLHYGRYLCRQWNKKREYAKKLDTFKIYYMSEATRLDSSRGTPRKILLWSHSCFKKSN